MNALALLFLKSLLIFAAAGVTLLALRRASSATRHLVCLLTLAALLILPGSFAGPAGVADASRLVAACHHRNDEGTYPVASDHGTHPATSRDPPETGR